MASCHQDSELLNQIYSSSPLLDTFNLAEEGNLQTDITGQNSNSDSMFITHAEEAELISTSDPCSVQSWTTISAPLSHSVRQSSSLETAASNLAPSPYLDRDKSHQQQQQRCPHCSRQFVYKMNFAKHITLGCSRDTSSSSVTRKTLRSRGSASKQCTGSITAATTSTSTSTTSTEPSSALVCSFCDIQFANVVYHQRHELAHCMVSKLIQNMQMSFTTTNGTSSVMDWFTSSIAINFADPQWTINAVQETEILLSQTSTAQLQMLKDDPDLAPMADCMLASPQPVAEVPPASTSGSKSILETQLVRPIMSHIILSNINNTNYQQQEPFEETFRGQLCNSLDVLLDNALRNRSENGSFCDAFSATGTRGDSIKAASLTPQTRGYGYKKPVNLSPPPLQLKQPSSAQCSNSYLCAECGSAFPTAAAAFVHMSRDHPLVDSLLRPFVSSSAIWSNSREKTPLENALRQQNSEKRNTPLPPCSTLFKKSRTLDYYQENPYSYSTYNNQQVYQGLQVMQNALSNAAGANCTVALVEDNLTSAAAP